MSLHHNPRIVTSGLVLALDPGDINSYPGSGTTMSDLSGRGNTATLENGAYYNSARNGQIRLDGTNDRISVADTNGDFDIGTSDFTVNLWINQGAWAQYPHLFAFTDQSNFCLKANRGNATSNPYQLYVFQGTSVTFANSFLTPGTWQQVTYARSGQTNKLYLDGEISDTVTNSSGPKSITTNTMYLGFGWATEYTYQQRGPVQMYNRALSADEIVQNYEAQKTRFGL